MPHIYTVKIDGERTVAHVQAKSKADAKKFALKGVEVTKLSAVEVLALVNAGLAIVDAETGNILNGDPVSLIKPDARPDQQPLDGVPPVESTLVDFDPGP